MARNVDLIKSWTQEEFERNVRHYLEIYLYGVDFDPAIFQDLDFEVYATKIRPMFEFSTKISFDCKTPIGFYLPDGTVYGIKWTPGSVFTIRLADGTYYLYKNDERLYPVSFVKNLPYHSKTTRGGTKVSDLLTPPLFVPDIGCTYSNECFIGDKGLACKFCNINATNKLYSEHREYSFKNAKAVGEAVKYAYEDGCNHFNLTGGFIPERRELEYYIDVAEAIQDFTGLEDFNGTAVIGAPMELSIIDKYKEAGYRTIATNIEIGDPLIWKAVCPGKDQYFGGREHWIECLKYEAQVFGKGRVRSGIVAGIESKDSILACAEELASYGVIPQVQPWVPNKGSAFEGHQSPTPEWHHELIQSVYAIHKKYGFTHQQVYDVLGGSGSILYDYFYDYDGDHVVYEKLG